MSYEPRDASPRVIGISAGLLALMVAGSIAVSAWYYHARYTGPGAVASAGRTTSFTQGPGETIAIVRDYAEVSRAAEERLHGYGWTDRKAGLARIPIERAMEMIAHGAKPPPAPPEPGQVP